MTINPNGTVSIPYPPITEKANGEKVRADHMQSNFTALEEGVNYQLDRYGKKPAGANISMGSHRLTNLGTPVSNGDATNKAYVDTSIANIPDATTAKKGLIQIATNEEAMLGENQTKAITPSILKKVVNDVIIDTNKALPIDYLTGFECSNSNDIITILKGYCRDSSNSVDLELTSSMTKSASLTWQEGTSEGGMAPNVNLSANSTYYIFVIGTLPIDATNGKFTTPNISSNITNFQSVSDGDLRVVVDGITQNLTGLDFTGISDLNGVALILNNSSLSGCSVSVSSNKLVFTSLSTGSASSVNISGIPGGSGTDISLTDYLNATDGTITNGTNFVKAKVDIGFDTNETANNLLNISELPYTTGYRYYRKIGLFKTDNSNNIVVCDETENKLTTSLNNITDVGIANMSNYLIPSYTQAQNKFWNTAYIADKDGILRVQSNCGLPWGVYINDALIPFFGIHDPALKDIYMFGFLPIKKGSKYIAYGGNANQLMTFYPAN
jgi:hypothetical protein